MLVCDQANKGRLSLSLAFGCRYPSFDDAIRDLDDAVITLDCDNTCCLVLCAVC